MKNNKLKFILSNYINYDFLYTYDNSCNCSLLNDNYLISGWRNFTFIDFNKRKKFNTGRHIWFNNTLWSDEKIYKLDKNNNATFLKFLTKTENHNLRSSGCEDFRFINWNNKNYVFYSKIEIPFYQYDEHFCELNETFNLINDKIIKTPSRIEKNWQPIEACPFECVYSYKPFKIINVITNEYKNIENDFITNYRGSSQIVEYKDFNIGIIHLRNETDKYHFYSHYFVFFDKNMKLIKVSKPFSFTGADIEFCTYLKHKNNVFEVLISINDQLTFKFNIPNTLIDDIFNDKLDNNLIDNTLYNKLFYFAKNNNNINTAICLGTYIKNKDILEDAIKLNYNSALSKSNKEILQKILMDNYK